MKYEQLHTQCRMMQVVSLCPPIHVPYTLGWQAAITAVYMVAFPIRAEASPPASFGRGSTGYRVSFLFHVTKIQVILL